MYRVPLIIPRNVQCHTAHCHENCQRRAAVAYERQRHAGERDDARDGCHIDERLERDDRAEADQDHRPNLSLVRPRQPEHAERVRCEKRHERAGAHESQLFRHDGKDRIVDRVGR